MKKERITIFVYLLICFIGFNKIFSQSSEMFLYETENNGYTYVDKNFRPLIKRTFKFAGRFFDDLAVASENGYVGYINKKGQFVIKPEFEYANPFHQGVAQVWKNGKPYLINKKGKILFEHNYLFFHHANIESFEPIFVVSTQSYKYGVIDKNGKTIIDTICDKIRKFRDGLTVVNDNVVMNHKGKIIIQSSKYSCIGDFHSGRAFVKQEEWGDSLVGYIDKRGNIIFKKEVKYQKYTNCFYNNYSDDLLVLETKDGFYTLFDKNGKEIYKSTEEIVLLRSGYAAIKDSIYMRIIDDYDYEDVYNIINKTGDLVCFDAEDVLVQDNKLLFVEGNKLKDMHGVINKMKNLHTSTSSKDFFKCREYFIHKNIFYIGKNESRQHIKWYSQNSKFDLDSPPDLYYIDPQGFKGGLLFVVFGFEADSGMFWGYLDEHGKVVYRNRNAGYYQKGVKENINYQQTTYNYELKKFDLKKEVNQGKISLIIDTTLYCIPYDNNGKVYNRICNKVNIINENLDTLYLNQFYEKQIIIQAKDRNGIWREIVDYPHDLYPELRPLNVYKLPLQHFWEFTIPSYSGGFKTKLRIIFRYQNVEDFEQWWWQKERMPVFSGKVIDVYSNEINCEINASQFVQKYQQLFGQDFYTNKSWRFGDVVIIE